MAMITPRFLSEIDWLLKNKLSIDVALIHVTPPDDHGFSSFGISDDYIKSGSDVVKVIIAQVNDKMPRALWDYFIHVNDIDCMLYHSSFLQELRRKIGSIEMAIGENCAKLISDSDTLQLGIGSIPDAMLKSLTNKRQLGIHS